MGIFAAPAAAACGELTFPRTRTDTRKLILANLLAAEWVRGGRRCTVRLAELLDDLAPSARGGAPAG